MQDRPFAAFGKVYSVKRQLVLPVICYQVIEVRAIVSMIIS